MLAIHSATPAGGPAESGPAILAFDTATEHMSVALGVGKRVWTREGSGGAQASAALIPAIQALLAEAGTTLPELDAIAFGRGPGAFTGLRTACSVAQGLALGTERLVLPVDTLLTVAEDARAGAASFEVWVLMDARMDEIYAGHYRFDAGGWQVLEAPLLARPEALERRWREAPPGCVAGNALAAFGDRLPTGDAVRLEAALPRAAAMLPLARALLRAGDAVDAADALPLYVRDKVAETTREREAARAAKAAGALG